MKCFAILVLIAWYIVNVYSQMVPANEKIFSIFVDYVLIINYTMNDELSCQLGQFNTFRNLIKLWYSICATIYVLYSETYRFEEN